MISLESSECVCNVQLILDGSFNIYKTDGILEQWLTNVDTFIHTK